VLDGSKHNRKKLTATDMIKSLSNVTQLDVRSDACQPGIPPVPTLSDAEAAEVAKRIYQSRRRRLDAFPGELFGEAAWDILLDLYIQQHLQKPVSVTSASIASTQPPTTALRWLAVLEDIALVERYPDPKDARRSWVRLTAEANKSLKTYLSMI